MSFFQDLFKNAKTIVNGGVDVLRDQLSSTYEVNKDAQGVPQVTNDSSIKVGPVSLPAPKAVKGVGNLAKDIAQGTARTVGTVGISAPNAAIDLGNKALGTRYQRPFQSEIPTQGNPITEAIFGGQPIRDAKGYGEQGVNFVNEITGKKTLPKGAALPIAALGVAMDLSGLGGTSKKFIESAIGTKTAKDALSLLKKAGFTDEAIKTNNLADKIVKATDEKAVKDILKSPNAIPTAPQPLKPVAGQKNIVERSFSKRAAALAPDVPMEKQLYEQRSTKELAQKAQNLWKDTPDEAHAMVDDIKSGAPINENHIAVVSEKLNNIRKELDTGATDAARKSELEDDFANLTNATAARLTQMGRDVQAAAILGRQTPEGDARFAARTIQKFNRENPKSAIPELTSKQADYIATERKAINEIPMGEERNMREFGLQNYKSQLLPSSTVDKISTVWKAGLLTGIKTLGLNLEANAGNLILEDLSKVPGSTLDLIISKVFGTPRTNVLTGRGMASGTGEGFARGWKYLTTGYDARNVGDKLDLHRVNFGNSRTAKLFQGYTDAVFRTMGATDQPNYYKAFNQSLWSQALANGENAGLKRGELLKHAKNLVDNPTDDMLKYAVHDGQTAVFQNDTALGAVAKRIQQTRIPFTAKQYRTNGGFPIGQFVLPFAKTPAAVAMQIINYTPVGAVKTIIENIGKGRFDQRLFTQGLGRSIVGTAPLVIGAEMYKNGLISLDFPKGDERQQELDKQSGKTYNAFKLSKDGDWQQTNALGPAGNLALLGAYFQKAFDESGSPSEAMVNAGFGALSSFTDQTFLTGFNKFTEAVQDPKKYASNYLANYAASAVPTIVSDVAKATDGYDRNSKGEGFVDNFKTRTQARIPGARESLPKSVNAYGTEMPRKTGPIESMINPMRPSPDTSNELTNELTRLTKAGQKVAPTKIGDAGGYKSLNPNEEEHLYNIVGDLVNTKLTSLVGKPEYQKLDDEKKAKTIDKITEQSKIHGRARFIMQQTDGMSEDETMRLLSQYKKDGLLTGEVFNVYKRLRNGE